MHKTLALCALLFACACGSSSSGGGMGGTTDGGFTTTDGGSSTTTTDGGSSQPKPQACPTEGAQEPCQGVSTGSCDPGVRTCTGGVWGACEGRVQPAPGLCDQPNCAGGENPGCGCRVGQVEECYSGPESAPGHGPCVKGVKTCVAKAAGSEWGPCSGEVLPQADDCSGRELDCDFTKTPDCTCQAGATRPCGGITGGTCVLGTQACDGGKWGDCVGAVQPVPGNCDLPSCAGGPNPGCECVNGESRACYTGLFGTENQGQCKAGTQSCSDGHWSACTGQTVPNRFCDNPSCTGTPLPSCQ